MESINPYAPTISTSEAPLDQHFEQQFHTSKVTSMAVASRTIAGISLAGGVFGVGLVLVMLATSGNFEPGMLLAAGIAFGFGLVIAGIAGFVTVSILIGLFHIGYGNSGSDAPSGRSWTTGRVVCFALLAGSISGFVSLAIPSGLAREALAWALVPAVVGAIGAYAMNRRCLRTLRQERLDQMAKESEPPAPLAFETPSI